MQLAMDVLAMPPPLCFPCACACITIQALIFMDGNFHDYQVDHNRTKINTPQKFPPYGTVFIGIVATVTTFQHC